MSEMQDYIGFTYNGVHSSDLGIVRVSNGSRFDENLLPTMQEKTVQVPGGDGTYFYGSYFTQRQFSVSFAYDNLNEQQLARLRTHFGDKKIHELVFDERPYKVYSAKVTGTATLKYIAFDEGEGRERIYKGEGTIQFTSYQPYAICKKRWLSEYECANKHEWAKASGLKETSEGYDVVIRDNNIKVFNAGDIECHFNQVINFNNQKKIPAGKVYLGSDQIGWSEMTAQGEDSYVKINSKLNLIEGYMTVDGKEIKTGTVYNQYVTEGAFFKLPQGESTIAFDLSGQNNLIGKIEYNYYYI